MIGADTSREIAEKVYLLYYNSQQALQEQINKKVINGMEDIQSWLNSKNKDLNEITKAANNLVTQLNSQTDEQSVIRMMEQAYNAGILAANKGEEVTQEVRHLSKATVRIAEDLANSLQKCNMQILGSAQRAYKGALGVAAANVTNGAETVRQATQRYMNMLSDQGVTTFKDKAGRNWNIASYAEMSVRTASGNAMLQGHIDRQLELGRDLVLVSAHAGCCPLCAQFQGTVLSLSGNDKRYLSLSEAQSAGLFHVCCEHSITGYIEGISETISAERSGYHPDQYKYIQEQRYNERQIRKWKDRANCALSPQEKSKAIHKTASYQHRQCELLNEYKQRFNQTLRRHYEREGTLSKATSGLKIVTPNMTPRAPYSVRGATNTGQSYFEKYKDTFVRKNSKGYDVVVDAINKTPPWYQEAVAQATDLVLKTDGKGAYFSPSQDYIAINMNTRLEDSSGIPAVTTFYHEFGHKLDNNLSGSKYGAISKNKAFTDAMLSDAKNTQNKYSQNIYGWDYDQISRSQQKEVNKAIGKDLMSVEKHAPSDIMGGLTNNEAVGLYGHSKQYWNRDNNVEEAASELFAHISGAIATGGKDLEIMQEYFPNATKQFEVVVKEATEETIKRKG